MLWDIFIAAGIGLSQLAITWYAVDISVRENRIRNALIIGFVGLFGIILTVGGAIRNTHSIEGIQKTLNNNQNASVALYQIVPFRGVQVLAPDRPLQFNVGYTVNSNTAKNLRVYFEMQIVDGPPSLVQDRMVSKKFKSLAVEKLDYRGQDRGVNTGTFVTVSVKPTTQDIDGILNGKKTIYILGQAEWINPSGSDGHLDTCNLMETPRKNQVDSPGWHDCDL